MRNKEGNTRNRKKIILGILLFAVGFGLLLYPNVSDYYNTRHSSEVIVDYTEKVKATDDEELQKKWEEAVRYNKVLYQYQEGGELTETELPPYESILNIDESGIMGFVDIPKIRVHLPIYHDTKNEDLQDGVGHIKTTSFPVGGKNTHAVLAGHTALPSARLFSDLDQMTVGDTFRITILGKEMYYVVKKVYVILPNDTEVLKIIPGKDVCSLLTCTPYGVGSHRLIVEGYRTYDIDQYPDDVAETVLNYSLIAMLAMVLLVLLIIGILITIALLRRKSSKEKQDQQN